MKKKKTLSIQKYLSIFKGLRLPWLFLILSVAGAILNYLFTLNLADLTADVVSATGDVETAKLASYVIAALMVVIGTTASYWFREIAAQKINLSLRIKLWKKLVRLPRNQYDKDGGEGFVSRITTDCTFSSTFFTMVVELASLTVGIVIYYVELFSTNATISAASVLILPVTVLIAWGYGKLCYIVNLNNQERLSETTEYLIERVYNMPLLRAANMQEKERQAGVQRFDTLYKVEIQKGLLASLNIFINGAVPLVSMAIVFVVGARFVNAGAMTAGGVYAFYLVANNAAVLFANIVEYAGSIRGSIGAMERVAETFEQSEEDVRSGEVTPENGKVTVDHVTFGYTEAPILNDAEITIPENKLTVIVGANGAGKSTLFRLLERFYVPNEGTICVNGKAAGEYSIESWRQRIGYMPQDGVLMAGTIRTNLSMGADHLYSDEEISAVVKQLALEPFFASLPDGFDSTVEAGGKNYSGGQKQLLGMMRVLLYDPEILLLDEATSSLDAHSAHQIKGALKESCQSRTVVMIAHDLQTILEADHAIILRDGKAVYAGDPRQVLTEINNYRKEIMGQ